MSVLNINWMVEKMKRREVAVFNGMSSLLQRCKKGSQGKEVRKWILQEHI